MKTVVWAGLASLLAACGGSSEEPMTAEPGAAPNDAMAEPAVGVDEGQRPHNDDGTTTSEEERRRANIKETRTLEVIRNEVLKHRSKVRACFDSLSREEKGNGGSMTIAFKISPKGVVQEAKLSAQRSTLKVPKLTTCAVGVFMKMKFPASSRGFESNANYPFNFKP